MTAPRRPPLRWYGGKWRDAPRILEHFPPHVCYVEPFCGGASVLLRKEPSQFEYINDLDGDVCNFFRVLREEGEELRRALTLTPFARAELWEAQDNAAASAVERARLLAVRSWQCIGANGGWRFTPRRYRRNASVISDWIDLPEWLLGVAERLRWVGIECDEAESCIRRYDTSETLFYVDPPYIGETRHEGGRRGYAVDMLGAEQHAQLGALLLAVEGMVVLSGYEHPLYEELYGAAGWRRVTWEALTNGAGTRRTEVLWINPRAVAARASTEAQPRLPEIPR